jgi:CheY-like chemotaxis protein
VVVIGTRAISVETCASGTDMHRSDIGCQTGRHMTDRPAEQPSRNADGANVSSAPTGVLLLDIEPAMASLLDEWLTRDGRRVLHAGAAAAEVDLIVIELAFPRQDGSGRLQQVRHAWPGVPVIVLSPTFLAGVAPRGEVARQLGAAAVLPAPVSRAMLRAAVAQVLDPA